MSSKISNDKISDVESSHESSSAYGETRQVDIVSKDANTTEIETLKLNTYDMWAVGITIVIGGQYFAWNYGLTVALGSFIIATFIVGTGYFALVLCIAELSSAIPFGGGCFAVSRVALGIFPGYLVGCCDSIQSVLYVAIANYALGMMITLIFKTNSGLEPLWWFIFYITATGIILAGKAVFWRVNLVLAVISFLILIMFLLGSIKYTNFYEYARYEARPEGVQQYFVGGLYDFMKILPLPAWFYIGVESINLASDDVADPKKHIPRGYISCMTTLFITSFSTLLICCSMPPGIISLSTELNPLYYGFSNMFNTSYSVATVLSLPATYATAFGFMFCYGRKFQAMAKSGILPTLIGASLSEKTSLPYMALILGNLIGFALCFGMRNVDFINLQIFNVSILGSVFSYFAAFSSFIIFRLKFENIKREYTNPLGIASAVYGIIVFTLLFISVIGFQLDHWALLIFAVYIILCTLYYYAVVQYRQFFSDEEQQLLFKAHLIKNNLEKKRKNQNKFANKKQQQQQQQRKSVIKNNSIQPHQSDNKSSVAVTTINSNNISNDDYVESDLGSESGLNTSMIHTIRDDEKE